MPHFAAGEHDIVGFDPTIGKVLRTLDRDGNNPGII